MCGYIWLAITRDTDHNQTLGQDSGGAIVYEYTNIEIAVTSPHTTPKLFFWHILNHILG